MINKPTVSVIVPTKNSQEFLDNCLESIKNQSYKNIEIIVVDNNSSDNTKEIAKRYTKLVFNMGPERSAQRNFGVSRSSGDYVLFIDSDMELKKNVIKECIGEIKNLKLGGVIIPEMSIGQGFWAKCLALEKSFYINVDWIEAARFFPKQIFEKVGGFDESLVSGEDWDLSQKIMHTSKIGRIKSMVIHNEGSSGFIKILSKKFYYARKISKYMSKNKKEFTRQSNVIKRYALFFSKPKKLFSNPFLGIGMLFLKTSEFTLGAIGYMMK